MKMRIYMMISIFSLVCVYEIIVKKARRRVEKLQTKVIVIAMEDEIMMEVDKMTDGDKVNLIEFYKRNPCLLEIGILMNKKIHLT